MGTAAPHRARRALLALAGALALPAAPVAAATFDVGSTADDTDVSPGDGECLALVGGGLGEVPQFTCTLRAAVQEANALAGRDTIVLFPGTHVLALGTSGQDDDDSAAIGDLDVTSEIDVEASFGSAPGSVVISADDSDVADAVFHVLQGGSLRLEGVTVRDSAGEGLHNQGTLDLFRTRVTSHAGPGILNDGGAVGLIESEVYANGTSLVPPTAGGIANLDGGLTLERSAIHDNAGSAGGIASLAGDADAAVIAVNSTISGNDAASFLLPLPGGGTTVVGGDGGGILQDETGGGGTATTLLYNVTVAGNAAAERGDGVRVSAGDFTIQNTVIAENPSPFGKDRADCSGTLASDGWSWVQSVGVDCTFVESGSDQTSGDVALGLLQDNGGPTPTHAPGLLSPLVDSGDPSGCRGFGLFGPPPVLGVDQRGEPRPADGDGGGGPRCDIGAVELLPEPGALALSGTALGALGLLGWRRRVPAATPHAPRAEAAAGTAEGEAR